MVAKLPNRAEYLPQELMHAKPWETLGVSRATWYRKGKPKRARPEAKIPRNDCVLIYKQH